MEIKKKKNNSLDKIIRLQKYDINQLICIVPNMLGRQKWSATSPATFLLPWHSVWDIEFVELKHSCIFKIRAQVKGGSSILTTL